MLRIREGLCPPRAPPARICQSLHSNYSLHGYFARHAHIGLDNHHVLRRKYFLSENDCMPDSLREFYNKVDIPTEEYDLFQLEN